jgi:hypothetical protein
MATKFTKRHYEAIATVIGKLAVGDGFMRRYIAGEFAAMFAADNDNFKHGRFMAACEPGANVKVRTRYAEAA